MKSAQTKLLQRVSSHQQGHDTRVKIDPAAHLDPGPAGHDVYGAVGHSLFRVPAVYLDKDLMKGQSFTDKHVDRELAEGSEDAKGRHACQRELAYCRRLVQAYVAGVKRPGLVKGGEMLLDVTTGRGSGVAADVSELMKVHLHSVVAAYDSVIMKLHSFGERELKCQAMNELGDTLMLSGNIRYVCLSQFVYPFVSLSAC